MNNICLTQRPASTRDDSETAAYYSVLNWMLVIAFSILLVTGFGAYFYVRRSSIYVRKRSILGAVNIALGTSSLIIVGPIQDIYGRQRFSCDAAHWIRMLGIACILFGVVFNVMDFWNRRQWAQVLAKLSFNRLQTMLKVTSKSSAAVVSDSGKSRVGLSTEYEPTETSVTDKSDVEAKFVQAMKRKMYGYKFLTMTIPIIPPAIVGFSIQFSEPYFGQGCKGCYIPFYHVIAYLAMTVFHAMYVLYYTVALRGVPDPLEIVKDLKLSMIIGTAIAGPGLIGLLIDRFIGGPYDNGMFSWDWLTAFAMMVVFAIQVVKPVYIWNKRRIARGHSIADDDDIDGVNKRTSFKEWMKHPSFQQAFSVHLTHEFSIENMMFYLQVTNFKSRYASFSTPAQINRAALDIYETFIQTGSILEVNLPYPEREEVAKLFAGHNQDTIDNLSETIPSTAFDRTQQTILELMETDSFPRFQKTAEYANLRRNSMVAYTAPEHSPAGW